MAMTCLVAHVRVHGERVEVVSTNGLTGRGEGAAGFDVTGRSPFEVEAIFDECGAAGLDLALWDLAAQCAGCRVRDLLGKIYRDELVEVRHVELAPGDEPPQTQARLGVTLRGCTEEEAFAMAARLEHANLEFFEPRVSLEAFRAMKSRYALPLAVGGDLDARALLRDYVQTGLADMVLPPVRGCGLTALKRLAYYCWLFRVRMAPCADSELTIAAAREVAAIIPPVTNALAAPPVFVLEAPE